MFVQYPSFHRHTGQIWEHEPESCYILIRKLTALGATYVPGPVLGILHLTLTAVL